MRKLHYILCIFILLSGCKTYVPYVPLDSYKRYILNESPGDIDVHRATEGPYRLDVMITDTVFARKRIEYYSTSKPSNRPSKIKESVFLYFIDDYRFVYSKLPLDTIDLDELPQDGTRIGIYDLYRTGEPAVTYIILRMTDVRVKKAHAYEYGLVTTLLKNNAEILEFYAADFPIKYISRQKADQSGAPFSADVINRDWQAILNAPVRALEAENLGLVARWYFQNKPAACRIDGKLFDNVLYANANPSSAKINRHYKWRGQTVYSEEINEDATLSKIKTW